METLKKNQAFIEDIVNGMFDWVRVVDIDNNLLFMNKAMSEGVGSNTECVKCYEVLGRSRPCSNCISRKAVFEGKSFEKEEKINDRYFSVMSSPLRNAEGKIIAAVEVLRETTQIKQLYKKMQEQNRKLKENLDMARKLQTSLLPGPPSDPRLDYSLIFMPCEALGGDFTDIFYIDGSHLGLYLADVSGHGVPASLLTIFLRSALNKKLLSPAKALEELYAEFNESKLDEELYISLFYAIIDLDEKTMLYSNAGLNVIPAVYGDNKFELLKMPGIPISNWMKTPDYKNGSIRLESGDKLFLYSDGILEMKNAENEQFGEDRLLDILLNSDLKPKQLLLHLKREAFRFAGIKSSSELQDDITMALLRIK
ncbi:MAG TPA: SpoIIE family protein phosphatase [Clostridia bacterium]|nr:SpoIIE family protein phosphatase [Clostridia bacterium]